MNTETRHATATKRANDAARVLARLKQGPAHMRDLLALTVGYRQRISQLRADGWIVQCNRTPAGSIFVLKGHRQAAQLELVA